MIIVCKKVLEQSDKNCTYKTQIDKGKEIKLMKDEEIMKKKSKIK